MENNSIHKTKGLNKDIENLTKYDLLLTAIPAILISMFLIGYAAPIPVELGIIAASLLSSGLILFGILDIAPGQKK